MSPSLNSNWGELHGIVLRAKLCGRQQKSQNLRISLGRPASHEVEQQEHQQSSKQTVEQVECGGAEAHGEEEEFSFGPENRERPG
jgi:hypothetical protein